MDQNYTPPGRISRFFEKWPLLVLFALGWPALMLAVSALADVLTPYAINATDLRNRLHSPMGFGGSVLHPFGTDELGRDVMTRLIFSIRMSVAIAFVAAIISAVIGTAVGLIAAHFRGVVEDMMMALADVGSSLPFMIIALAVLAIFGSNLFLLVCLMGLSGWERYARLTRGLTISAKEQGYARAVRQLGASPARVYLVHILPNIGGTLLVTMTLTFPEVILLETGLSFLGLGVQPPASSLGNMIGFGRQYLHTAPWILLAPSAVVVLTTPSISTVGDWLRDRMDPTLH
ncbi:peptide/nickel transport system permease protein [Amaricoccus macauensis]|uniref:Peptide/nickel transport system permease protein n=1 Tax=Amaricoccus macauensis TaxID=57001 RepID=A0A840SRM1_9RHOB|nr:ABC transporter permease [Amaricoccus macauensis]MBB5221862.1 peptide/nickel transport system permease protein [Amaricoccus macauensis]